ncbi:hypothetical protein [Actinacidiphila soli]|uniref:hypothetical protein n=1 Tax=Actinacidiphila soli TaxID=2487275 RepID=UPI002AFEB11F|nr:hypothetical protein [Actinacidiphila soli]
MTASGVPSVGERWVTLRITTAPSTGPAVGSSPSTTDSSRSTLAKSANLGTTVTASSWTVRVTSSVVPMAAAASLSSAIRCRAQCCSLLSKAASATARTRPEGSRTGHISVFQACSRVPDGARVWLS